MDDLPFPEFDVELTPLTSSSPIPTPVAPVATVAQTVSQIAPIVPDLGIPSISPVSVPNVLTNTDSSFQPIPEWTYKRFQVIDILYSKVGISAITSLLTFSILSITNPPFVQEVNDNPIEISRPSLPVLYCISLVIFMLMMVVPVSK